MTNEEEKPWLEEVPAEAETENRLEKYRPQLIAAGVVVLVAFLGLIFYAYQSGKDGAPAEVPVVRGPEGAVKKKPEEPGGVEIPDRDKLVYNRVSGEEEEDGVALEAGPELPKEPPAAVEEPAPEVAAAPAEEAAPEPAPEPAPEAVAEPEPAPEPVAAPVAVEGNYVIQLGAYGSRDSAARAWDVMQDKHAAVLGSLVPDYEPLKRAGGTLYRLRAGGFADRAGAEQACAQLKVRGQDCFPAER